MNNIIYTNNQFPLESGIPSELPDSIKNAYGCTMKDAYKYAKTHCNALSFFAVLTAIGSLKMSYTAFLAWGLKSGAINMYGFIDREKEDILKDLNIPLQIITNVMPFTNSGDKVYQMKITNDNGTHFMVAYTSNGTWYLSDSNNRGVGVTWDALKKGDKVEWLKEFI